MDTTGRRDRKKQQTRTALVDAALRLAAERGLANVTVDDITEAADVSSRTFFNYFSSKDEAILDGHLVGTREVAAILSTLVPDMPVLAALRLSLNFAIAQIEEEREQVLLRMRVIEANPDLLNDLIAGGAESERELAQVVTDRLGLEPDHPFPPLIVAVTGAAFRAATIDWYQTHARRPLGEHVDEAFTAVAAGLPDPPTRDKPAPARARTRSRKDAA